MTDATVALTRIEGGLSLEQDDNGAIRLVTRRWRGLEALLTGRAGLEAVYLTQQCGADASVSHALAAALACENAAGVTPPRNGLLLRELLQNLAAIHAHLRHFYLQALPDYLPWADLAAYRGARPEVQRAARALKGRPAAYWARQSQPHPFSAAQVERLADNQARALEALDTVQRMLARLGGKFPMVMSIVPGGCTVPLTDALLIELRQELQHIAPLADGLAYEDAALVVALHPRLKTLGRAGTGLMSVGSQGEGLPQAQTLMPAGIYTGERFESYAALAAESVARSFYELPAERRQGGPLLVPAPGRANAYSWIKAPRHQGRPMEVGALARLALLHHSVAAGDTGDLLDELAKALGGTLTGASSVAGRMLARAAETRILVRRCGEVLEQLAPGQPTVAEASSVLRATGDGSAEVEAPAGALRHRTSLEKGKILLWDIIGPSTWNGSPRDESGQRGPIEAALAGAGHNLRQKEDRLAASRIVHSFCFSTIDAIQ